MISKSLLIALLLTCCACQWAFLGVSRDSETPGKFSGNNLWPSSRTSPGFCFDGKEMFLFGGQSQPSNKVLNDFWVLNVETTEWNILGPIPFSQSSAGSLVDQRFKQLAQSTLSNIHDY